MAGQIVKRGASTWLVRVPRGRDANGKRIYHNRTIKGTKKDAERYRTKVLRELDTGCFVEASQESVAAFLRQWLASTAATRVRPRTLEDYRSLAERHLVPALGHHRLAQLSPPHIQALYAAMQSQGLSSRTIRYAHSVLHSALQQAVLWSALAHNPAKRVTLPRQERREMRALSREEASRLLQAAEGTRFGPLWALLLCSGLRPGEALALKWSDMTENRLNVQRTLVRIEGNQWTLVEPKTARARRVVTLPVSAVEALHRHRASQLRERLQAGERWQCLDLIFANRAGGPLEWRVLARRYFPQVLKGAGLSGVRPYDLRHSCATLLLSAGENVKVVSERLGHASASLTLDVYSHVLPDMQQGAADRLESMLFSPLGMVGH